MITHVYKNRNAIQNHRGKLIELTIDNVEEITREAWKTEEMLMNLANISKNMGVEWHIRMNAEARRLSKKGENNGND